MGQPSHLKKTRQSGNSGENDDIVPVLQCFMFVAQYIYCVVCFGFLSSYVTRFLRLLQNIAHIWGSAVAAHVCVGFFCRRPSNCAPCLPLYSFPSSVGHDKLTLQALWGRKQNGQWWREQESTLSLWCILRGREHICWFMYFHTVRSGCSISLSLLLTKSNRGFFLRPEDKGVYLGKPEATKLIRP